MIDISRGLTKMIQDKRCSSVVALRLLYTKGGLEDERISAISKSNNNKSIPVDKSVSALCQ